MYKIGDQVKIIDTNGHAFPMGEIVTVCDTDYHHDGGRYIEAKNDFTQQILGINQIVPVRDVHLTVNIEILDTI